MLFQREKFLDIVRAFAGDRCGSYEIPAHGHETEKEPFGRVGQYVLYRIPHIVHMVDDQPVKDDAQHNHAQQGKIAFPLDDKPNIGQDKESK